MNDTISMHGVKAGFAIMICGVLAACGSSGTNGSTGSGGSGGGMIQQLTFDEYLDRGDRIEASIAGASPAQPGALPGGGTVQYEGVLLTNLTDRFGATGDPTVIEEVVTGDLVLAVDFGGGATEGSFSNLVNPQDELYTGQLDVSGLTLAPGTATVAGDIGGTVRNAADEPFVVDGQLTGAAFDGGAVFAGQVSGTVTGPEGTGETIGGWVVEQQ